MGKEGKNNDETEKVTWGTTLPKVVPACLKVRLPIRARTAYPLFPGAHHAKNCNMSNTAATMKIRPAVMYAHGE